MLYLKCIILRQHFKPLVHPLFPSEFFSPNSYMEDQREAGTKRSQRQRMQCFFFSNELDNKIQANEL